MYINMEVLILGFSMHTKFAIYAKFTQVGSVSFQKLDEIKTKLHQLDALGHCLETSQNV